MISKEAEAIKQEMVQAVALRRELRALEEEWRDLLTILEEAVGETAASSFTVAQAVNEQRAVLRRALAETQLKNWARIGGVTLSPTARRVMGLRYVLGYTWGDLVARVGKAKQYLLREHNKALEALARKEKRAEKSL